MNLREMRAKNPTGFKLEAKPGDGKSIVYLYGDIVDEAPTNWLTGEPEAGDFITPKGVRETVGSVKEDEIELHINSYGGSVFASVAIKNYLKGLGKNITVVVDGIAASGGSIIAMAGSRVHMGDGAMMMIHRASGMAYGDVDDMLKMAEVLEKIDKSVLSSYQERFNGSFEELKELVGSETWLTAEEAVEKGLADEVVKEETEEIQEETEETQEEPNISNGRLSAFVDAAFFSAKNYKGV